MALPRSRLKTILQNLGLFVGSLGFCFVVLEVLLRLNGYGNVEIYDADPVLYWKLKPNQNCYTKIDRKPVHVNSHGTRGPEFTVTKPPNALRIVSLGDSRTFGWGLAEEETYSGLLQKRLQESLAEKRKVEVINAGVNAWSYAQLHVYFRDRALQYQPDFVLVAEANLWTQFSEKNSPEFVKKFMSRVRLKNFLRRFATYHYIVEVQLKEVYERQRTKFIPVDPHQDTLFKEQQQKDPSAFFREAIEALCRLALQNGVKPVLVYLPTLTELAKPEPSDILKAKRAISQQLGVPLIDLTSDLAPQGKSLYLEADPVHLNAAGNRIVAQRLYEQLSRKISP
jgi:alginate O-acetyltransferase complex protein AlgI